MEIQNPNFNLFRDTQKDGQAQSNLPPQLFQSLGYKNCERLFHSVQMVLSFS